MVEDMEVVADANGLDKFAILAYSQSCAVSIAYAVRHPERVTRMVFYGVFAHTFLAPEEIEAFATLFAKNWGQDNAATRQLFTSAFFPDSTKEEFDAFNELQRNSVSPSLLIPGARFLTLSSRNHLVLESEPEYRRVVAEMAAFVKG
jgi:pimeloyl-ACP methyl ester carboxylesterase